MRKEVDELALSAGAHVRQLSSEPLGQRDQQQGGETYTSTKTHTAAEMRTDTETSTAGELNVHRAPRRPRQVLHAGGPGERQVQRAGELGGL